MLSTSRHATGSAPSHPLKFPLPEFSPGGYYSGKFHPNPFSGWEFSELGGGWEGRACFHLCWGAAPDTWRFGVGEGGGEGGSAMQGEAFIPKRPLLLPLLEPFN